MSIFLFPTPHCGRFHHQVRHDGDDVPMHHTNRAIRTFCFNLNSLRFKLKRKVASRCFAAQSSANRAIASAFGAMTRFAFSLLPG